MRISRQPSPVQTMTDEKQSENVKYFKHLGSIISNGIWYTREIKSRIVMAKASFNKEKIFYHQIVLNFKEETTEGLHLKHSFAWCWKLDTSESRSRIRGKFWNVVLEKDGEDQGVPILWEMKESRKRRIHHRQ